jgi:hypothetical protein
MYGRITGYFTIRTEHDKAAGRLYSASGALFATVWVDRKCIRACKNTLAVTASRDAGWPSVRLGDGHHAFTYRRRHI